MNGKENIINKILADADAKCAEILADAQRQAQEISDGAAASVAAEEATLQKRLDALSAECSRNYLASAQLSARKYKLLKKQQLISACYEKVLKSLQSLSSESRKKLLSNLLQNYAEEGETVRITKADKDVVTQKFLDTFKKNLTLGSEFAEASGGLILEGVGYDKDLTLEKIVSYAREQTEAQVAHALFGE